MESVIEEVACFKYVSLYSNGSVLEMEMFKLVMVISHGFNHVQNS